LTTFSRGEWSKTGGVDYFSKVMVKNGKSILPFEPFLIILVGEYPPKSHFPVGNVKKVVQNTILGVF
jgi:hypothetical protein